MVTAVTFNIIEAKVIGVLAFSFLRSRQPPHLLLLVNYLLYDPVTHYYCHIQPQGVSHEKNRSHHSTL